MDKTYLKFPHTSLLRRLFLLPEFLLCRRCIKFYYKYYFKLKAHKNLVLLSCTCLNMVVNIEIFTLNKILL